VFGSTADRLFAANPWGVSITWCPMPCRWVKKRGHLLKGRGGHPRKAGRQEQPARSNGHAGGRTLLCWHSWNLPSMFFLYCFIPKQKLLYNKRNNHLFDSLQDSQEKKSMNLYSMTFCFFFCFKKDQPERATIPPSSFEHVLSLLLHTKATCSFSTTSYQSKSYSTTSETITCWTRYRIHKKKIR
jgi:hypothetical protein